MIPVGIGSRYVAGSHESDEPESDYDSTLDYRPLGNALRPA